MTIDLILARKMPPIPWEDGDKIPWNDPGFSQRMLKEHLSQEHQLASRRFETIDRHVGWIFDTLLDGQPQAVLDLGCGPGLYTQRLARLGCTCTGIDFSPASIAYARHQALQENLPSVYHEADLRRAYFGKGFDLAMLIFGELNVFRRAEALAILKKAYRALQANGKLLLEVHRLNVVRQVGLRPSAWSSHLGGGLFSEHPHLLLEEAFWNEELRVATERYFVLHSPEAANRIVDAAPQVSLYAASMQGYDRAGYRLLLAEAGFRRTRFEKNWGGWSEGSQDFNLIVAEK